MRKTSYAVSGKGQKLRLQAGRADKGSMVPVVSRDDSKAVRRHKREEGQALVEFALIIPLFLMIVVGIIQFGVALNFWLDLQRIANQGARWAAVNCGQSAAYPGSDPCKDKDGNADIEGYLRDQIVSRGNKPKEIEVCWVSATGSPVGTAKPGDPVKVRIKTEYVFLGITGFLRDNAGLTMDLNADATMRLEQSPTSPALAGVAVCPPPP